MKAIETREAQMVRLATGDRPVTWAALDRELELAEQRGREQALGSQYLTIQEAAKMLRVCRESIYNYINSGKLTCVRSVGGYRLVRASDLVKE